MEEWRELFEKGMQFEKSAKGLAISRKYSDSILLGAFTLSAEYYLGSIVSLKDIYVYHGGLKNLVNSLKKEMSLPDNIDKLIKKLTVLTISCNNNSNIKNTPPIPNELISGIIEGINQLSEWTKSEIKAVCLAKGLAMEEVE
jgi:hypothetical protein